MRRWIDRPGAEWWVPSTKAEAKQKYREKSKALRASLQALLVDAQADTVLVPDTNALIACADWPRYSEIAGTERLGIVLMPTVLRELDKLKTTHRENDFRSKVRGVISRIKGLRQQAPRGLLSDGVTVHKTIRIRLLAHEPDFEATLSWLDPANEDDRLVASSLELQRNVPTSVVVLVTEDINLQNKAEAAKLPYAEPPATGNEGRVP